MKKLLLTTIFFVISISAKAAMVTYELHDVVFDDGATAYGSFDRSPSNGSFANIVLTTTAGQKRNYDVTYTTQAIPSVIGVNFGISLSSITGNDTSFWDISFESNGPSTGSLYLTSLTNRPTFIKAYAEKNSQKSYTRYVISGYIAPVPIPATSWLLGTSLAALLLRKKYPNC